MSDTPVTPTEAPVPLVPEHLSPAKKREVLEAFRRGDAMGLLQAFTGTDIVDPKALDLARFAIEVRRQNVATLGSADAFIRRTAHGELAQVIMPVTLSLDDGTLYQIPDRFEKVLREDPTKLWNYKTDKDKPWNWRGVINNPRTAHVSYEGFLRMNGIAGCSVTLPSVVNVDGTGVPNPYVGRDDDGDITRIVISVGVAGPSPATGNIVIVQYVLDLDPRADLLHMLSGIMQGKKKRNDPSQTDQQQSDEDADAERDAEGNVTMPPVFLVSRAEFNEYRAALPPPERRRWHWTRLHGGVGLAHDLGNRRVRESYDKFVGILENLVKKAITVAKRNAMKSHPALARHSVDMKDVDGALVRHKAVPVVGWTSAGVDTDKYHAALEAVARGDRAPGVELIVQEQTYQPERDQTGDPELDATTPEDDDAPAADPNVAARNRALQALDEAVAGLTPAAVARLGYPPPPDATPGDIDAMAANAAALRKKS